MKTVMYTLREARENFYDIVSLKSTKSSLPLFYILVKISFQIPFGCDYSQTPVSNLLFSPKTIPACVQTKAS